MAYLALVRHTESIWNEKGLWTGWTDVDLDPKGIEDARKSGALLQDIHFDYAYTSDLIRAQETLTQIKQVLNIEDLPTSYTPELKEKNYGDYTGKNKWEIEKEVGEEEFHMIRRSWDYVLPHGESLKDVYHRVVAYYTEDI
jgi:2,3-bisphosphoglycerate-dependent phosphoglycerate mutase